MPSRYTVRSYAQAQSEMETVRDKIMAELKDMKVNSAEVFLSERTIQEQRRGYSSLCNMRSDWPFRIVVFG